MNECIDCGRTCDKNTKLCKQCGIKLLKKKISEQITHQKTHIIILVGDLLAKETANTIIETINEHKEIITIELKARGNHINRAVDVLEILKRELKIKNSNVTTHTRDLTNREGQPMKISEINIQLKQ